tara:strand:- start:1835 stop:2050 length:216 start_codon:yes stop_codon:yes gene_type:complete
MKTMTLPDFLTSQEIKEVERIWRTAGAGKVAKQICEQVIQPNMARINKALGQENDAMYLAYACEHVMNQTH